MTADDCLLALDGRTLDAAGVRYAIEVFSVRDEAGHCWVQLALDAPGARRLLTLCLEQGDSAQHAVHVLRSWLTNPDATPDVVNVAYTGAHLV